MTKTPSALGCWTVFEETVHSFLGVFGIFHYTEEHPHTPTAEPAQKKTFILCVCVCVCIIIREQIQQAFILQITFVYYISFVIPW